MRTIFAKLKQARRFFVRAELTLGALQAAVWLGLAAAVLGAALMLRTRKVQPVNPIGEASGA